MSNHLTPSIASPFDALRKVDAQGEFWLARELMSPLGYESWRRFEEAIERGRAALAANEQDADVLIAGLTAPANGVGAGATRSDYRMTREGVYATIQGADPRKPEIAAAWSYFRTKTREAEAGAIELRNPALQQVVTLALQMQATQDEQERLARIQTEQGQQLTSLAHEVATVKELIPHVPDGSGHSVKDLAHAAGTPFKQMHEWLRAEGITYHDKQRGGIKPYAEWISRGWAIEKLEEIPKTGRSVWVPYFTDTGFAEVKRRARAV